MLTITYLIWPKIAFKLSTMVEENFEFHSLMWPKIAFKLSTMVEENFDFYLSFLA